MAGLLTVPPAPEQIMAMGAIPATTIAPAILVTQQGPEGHRGPEEAGALLMLQATFSDEVRAQGFWAAAVPLFELLAKTPGFIRRYSFMDGSRITLLALWQTVADANAFAASAEHRAAVRGLFREKWQYSHFSAVWEMSWNGGRFVFCEACDATSAAGPACEHCGAALADVYC
jgi:heme-degrading monooxygenase HmoA